MFSQKTKIIVKYVVLALAALGAALGSFFGLTSCNVTRTITTSSSSYMSGDTSVVIQSKTIESYNATKNL